MNKQTLALLLSGAPALDYAVAIKRHMKLVDMMVSDPPASKFRGELQHEKRRRQYWQTKMGKRWSPWEFICVYPMLSKNVEACFVSRAHVIRDYFSAAASEKHKANRKKYHSRGAPGTVYLPTSRMARVKILVAPFEGQAGFVTAIHPVKGYRVTIWPDEKWKSKIRRWCPASALTVTGERPLPPLPPPT